MSYRTLLIFLALTGAAYAQERDEDASEGVPGDRFIIPPEAMSPLRRSGEPGSRVVKPRVADAMPEVLRDESALPPAVGDTRTKIIEAAKTGDIAKLRGLIGTGDRATQLAFDELETDPIEFLIAASGDPEGHEMLAILIEVLESGFVRVEDEEGVLFVWPYFAAVPVDRLTPAMKVELFRLLTGGDYDEMREFGAYVFYRVGISETGEWRFFLSGDG